jgi:hypothetical protein
MNEKKKNEGCVGRIGGIIIAILVLVGVAQIIGEWYEKEANYHHRQGYEEGYTAGYEKALDDVKTEFKILREDYGAEEVLDALYNYFSHDESFKNWVIDMKKLLDIDGIINMIY